MKKRKICITAPVHIQPSKEWVRSLEIVGANHKVIITDDSDGKVELPNTFDVYGYERQKQVMGDELYKGFEQFHKSAACKNFGTWLAYQQGYDVVIIIDSDCIVPPDLVSKHLEALDSRATGWQNPIPNTGFFSRGFPYHERNRRVVSNMGLWENELDLYGTDRIGVDNVPKQPMPEHPIQMAHGIIPFSGMNIAIIREAIPALLFLPNFTYKGGPLRRHDDIWGGYIFQKIAQKMYDKLTFGLPIVYHDTVVIPEEDALEEIPMIEFEEEFMNAIDKIMCPVDVSNRDYQKIFKRLETYSSTAPGIIGALYPAFNFWVEAFK